MEKLLEKKTIVIAGASGLLGANLVIAALAQGANVIAADINLVAMHQRLEDVVVNACPDKLTLIALDITSEIEIKTFFAQQNNIDGAVNATYPKNKTYGAHFFDVSLASFNENLALHLGSSFLFMQQCAAYFKKYTQSFSLVNISSIYGVIAPKFKIYKNTSMTMPVEYAAIKSAIQHLNKYVVSYVRDSRFRVNSISPGGVSSHQNEIFLSAYRSQTHGAGLLNVKEVASAILFLLSDQSRYITGQNIIIDDGFSL